MDSLKLIPPDVIKLAYQLISLLGLVIVLNFGMIIKIWLSAREKQKNEAASAFKELATAVKQNTISTNKAFTAIKLLAGDKWPQIRESLKADLDQ